MMYPPITCALIKEKTPSNVALVDDIHSLFGDGIIDISNDDLTGRYGLWGTIASLVMTKEDYLDFIKRLGNNWTHADRMRIFRDIYKMGKPSLVDKIVKQAYK
jgi:hypothetical protein